MVALPEPIHPPELRTPKLLSDQRPAGLVIPLRNPNLMVDWHDGDSPNRIAPARGLVLGVLLGALLWVGIGLLAWLVYR